MAKRIVVKDLNVFYGDFQAVDDVNMTIEPRRRHRVHRPVRLRQDDVPAHAEPDERARSPAAGSRASPMDDQDIYAADVDPVSVRRDVGMVFQRPNPFPTMSIYENVVAGLRLNGERDKTVCDDRRAVAAPRQPVGRGARTGSTGPAPGFPAASSSGCASPGRSPCSRRCC